MNEDLGCCITELIFNDGTHLSLSKNDIVVFVGPNNSGKSQSLKDIYACCQSKDRKGIVVSDISIKTSTEGLKELLPKIAVFNKSVNSYYYFGQHLYSSSFTDGSRMQQFASVFISFLRTEERLSYCNPKPNINKGENLSHPMQLMIDNTEYSYKLSSLFNKAFQQNLYCHARGRDISIRVGLIDNNVVSGNRIDVANTVLDDIGNLPHIEEQGDGMRSFVSILLSLGLNYKRIHLFDEPESFLHQAQARIIGRMIGEELKSNQQAFISTHSTDFIKGLLEKAESRVKIVRITRNGNINHFHILDNNKIQDVCNDEMLKHTNLLEGLFNNKVVICESDIDCLLYSSIEEHLLNLQGRYSESLYLFTGGKSAFKKTIVALQGLGIAFKAILDLDALNEENLIKNIYEVCGGNWIEDIKPDYDNLLGWINRNGSIVLTKENAKKILGSAVDKCNNELLSSSDIRTIKSSLKSNAMWEKIKLNGRNAIADSDIVTSFDKILLLLKQKNIFLLPFGEIESFFPDVEGHSHKWLQKVFKNHPTFDDPAYSEVKEFVKNFS